MGLLGVYWFYHIVYMSTFPAGECLHINRKKKKK